ncbi:hypothetical protein M6B22_06210 [Jatrophihabitans cynanchi]|uniref:Uncharacterized protein n=1 Tax=Jatrophihabitans cynanchi TaxID=2944128 RepID=A0ABY7K2D7_9ACTN|nr:hypothetical protein [Jatrophihabitans sp. SB3-54]WAX58355.1 hypothetical protein M6B22_06210 [Jatrophihabitans sp. SB3-54]
MPASTSNHRDDGHLYIAFAEGAPADRHVSAVPLVAGLEALCGYPVIATSAPTPWRHAIAAATCPACQRAAIAVAGAGALTRESVVG